MTGTKIHGYLITASRRTSEKLKDKYETVFIYEDTSGKFVWSDKIDDDIALQSWVGQPGASYHLDDVSNKFEQMKRFSVREFWHTLS